MSSFFIENILNSRPPARDDERVMHVTSRIDSFQMATNVTYHGYQEHELTGPQYAQLSNPSFPRFAPLRFLSETENTFSRELLAARPVSSRDLLATEPASPHGLNAEASGANYAQGNGQADPGDERPDNIFQEEYADTSEDTETDSVTSLPDDLPREFMDVLYALLGNRDSRYGYVTRMLNDAATQRSIAREMRPLPTEERRRRTAFTGSQLLELERAFFNNNYLNRISRIQLANRLGLSETQIKVWFQNRRVKERRAHGDLEPVRPARARCSQRCIRPRN